MAANGASQGGAVPGCARTVDLDVSDPLASLASTVLHLKIPVKRPRAVRLMMMLLLIPARRMETQTLSAREAVARVVRDWWGLGYGECLGGADAWDWSCEP